MPSPLALSRRPMGLEIWAVGTWDELAVLRAHLAAAGSLLQTGDPQLLVGVDAGRYRQYLRVHTRSE